MGAGQVERKKSCFDVDCSRVKGELWWTWSYGRYAWRWDGSRGLNCQFSENGKDWAQVAYFRSLEHAVCYSAGFLGGYEYRVRTVEELK